MSADAEQEQKQYALRLSIEGSLHALLEAGFTVDEVEEFVDGVVYDMREEES